MSRHFDARFGSTFLDEVPKTPGVYEMLDAAGRTLYVGKAKNLKLRLGQYRRASRKKVHAKMRAIVRDAASVRLRPCATELEALLLENQLIQSLRPPHNVAGAFTFLYPCVGVRVHETDVDLCCTTSPAAFDGFVFYGAFRDRRLVRAAFEALTELLDFVGHREPASRLKDLPRVKFSRVVRYRRLSTRWVDLLDGFFRGDARTLLSQLVLALVERPAARRHADETQAHLTLLGQFFELEAHALRSALTAVGRAHDLGISQAGRDPLFLAASRPG